MRKGLRDPETHAYFDVFVYDLLYFSLLLISCNYSSVCVYGQKAAPEEAPG
jgi:hypothetical protein